MTRWGDWRRRDHGQAALGYVGAILAAVLVVGSATVAVASQQTSVTHAADCAVTKLVSMGQRECLPAPIDLKDHHHKTPPPKGDPDFGHAPTDCHLDVIHVPSTNIKSELGVEYVQINCLWYKLPPQCMALFGNVPDWKPGLTPPAGTRSALQDLIECAKAGNGPPSSNPDDVACANTTPMTGADTEDPPAVQIGCTKWIVPKGCESEWKAFLDIESVVLPAGKQAVSDALSKCVSDYYDKNEEDCVVSAESNTTTSSIKLMFFIKLENSDGVLYEKFGDGHWRVHVLTGMKSGFDFELPDNPLDIEFSLTAMTGADKDQAYEFPDKDSADAWVEWYNKYSGAKNHLHEGCGANKPGVGGHPPLSLESRFSNGSGPAGLAGGATVELAAMFTDDCIGQVDLDKLEEEEPSRTHHSDSESKSAEMSVGVGVSVGDAASVGGSAEYEGEGSREVRTTTSGETETSLSMESSAGIALMAGLGKESDGTGKGKKGDAADLGLGVGGEASGKTTLTVVWDNGPPPTPKRITLAVDSSMMATLASVDVGLTAGLPNGFTVGSEFNHTEEAGVSTVREKTVDLTAHPDLIPSLMPLLNDLYPQDDDGTFKLDEPDITFDHGGFSDILDTYGTIRDTKYTKTDSSTEASGTIGYEGIPLIQMTYGTEQENDDLVEGSDSLALHDVNGKPQKQNPAPKCHMKQVDPDDWEYDEGPPYADRD